MRADQPRLRRDQILLRVQHVDRGALAALRLLAHALQRDASGTHLGFRSRHRNLGAFIGDPGADRRGAGLIADLIEHQTALCGQFLGLPGLRRRGAAIVDWRVHLGDH